MMKSRRTFLSGLGLFAVGIARAVARDSSDSAGEHGKSPGRLKGVRSVTVEELGREVHKKGFQWEFVGCQITFDATVLVGGTDTRMRIDGMDRFDLATIHNARKDLTLEPSQRMRVRGLIVDQWYGVWQIWCYEMTKIA